MRTATVIAIVAAALPLGAQSTIQMGEDAARFFVYGGQPVHPFCVFFPFDSARKDPLKLAECTNDRIVPEVGANGWVEASTQTEDLRYRVLARQGDRFLVASFLWGGGSGRFSRLAWLQLSGEQIVVSKPEWEGDRCSGGLQGDYVADRLAYTFGLSLTARDAVSLANVPVAGEILSKLRYGAQDCDGVANYSYDVSKETMTLTSVSLNGAQARVPNTPVDACFDRMVSQSSKKTLTPEELRDFVKAFAVECARRR